MKTFSDELIRKGNTLMIAAKDGRIGLNESELRALQECYLKSQRQDQLKTEKPFAAKMGPVVICIGIVGGGLMLLGGIFSGDTLGIIFGVVIEGIILSAVGNGRAIRSKAKVYVELVNSEYPKLTKVT